MQYYCPYCYLQTFLFLLKASKLITKVPHVRMISPQYINEAVYFPSRNKMTSVSIRVQSSCQLFQIHWCPSKPRPIPRVRFSLWSKVCERVYSACIFLCVYIYELTQMCILELRKHGGQEVSSLTELCYTRLRDRWGTLLSRLVQLGESVRSSVFRVALFSSSKLMNNLSSLSPSINHPTSLLHQQPCDKTDKLIQCTRCLANHTPALFLARKSLLESWTK